MAGVLVCMHTGPGRFLSEGCIMNDKTLTIEGVCGNCACWREQVEIGIVELGRRRGVCYALPPTPFARLDKFSGKVTAQVNLRAGTFSHEGCMAFFVPRPELVTGAANEG